MVGNWNVDVHVGANLPQKVQSAFDGLRETLLGAEYEALAYLGSQVVNGTNHAVLAEQTVLSGRDTKNVVVVIFNEKPNDMNLTLVNIERVIESGAPMGGIVVDPKTEIPAEAQAAWDTAFEGFVGSKVTPFAYLGSQVVKGTDYIFVAEIVPMTRESNAKVAIVTVNGLTKQVTFSDLLEDKHTASLGYAFTWLKGGLGAPLGEWP